MNMAVDASRLRADAGQIRGEIDHLTTAMRDAHNALGRIEAQVQALIGVVGGAERENENEREGGLAMRMERIAYRGDELQRGLYHVSANIDRVVAAVETSAARNERMQLGLDALRIGQQASTDIDGVHFEQIQIGLGALRVNQQSCADADKIRGERLEVVADALRRDQQSLVEHSGDLLDRTQHLINLSGILVSRADVLVHRAAIPLGTEILMRIPEGLLLVPADDTALVAHVWESHGRLEPGTVRVVKSLLAEGDEVIDVGANIGLITLPAARVVGPTGRVTALEPAARIADLLDRSMSINFGPGRVTLHRKAAGEASGTARLQIGATAGHSSLLTLSSAIRNEEVEVVRLDDVIEPGRTIKLVKIDAEGFELPVWRGMSRILAENPDLIVVVEFGFEHLLRAGIDVADWLDAFLSPGFVAFEIEELTGVLKNIRDLDKLTLVSSLNLLLLRRPASAYPMLEFA